MRALDRLVLSPSLPCRSRPAPQALFDAVRAGDRQAVRSLIAKKADVNATQVDGSTALHLAVDAGADEIARLLLGGRGATPRRRHATA